MDKIFIIIFFILFLLVISSIIFVIFKIYIFQKKNSQSNSVIIPLVLDLSNKRLRIFDSNFYHIANKVFNSIPKLSNGEWITFNDFSDLLIKKDKQIFLKNLEDFNIKKIKLSFKNFPNNKYVFLFSSKNDEFLIIYRNKNVLIKNKKINWIKNDNKIYDFKSINFIKKNNLFLIFKPKNKLFNKKDVEKIIEDISEKEIFFRLSKFKIIYENNLLIFIFSSNIEKKLQFLKTYLIKKMKKYKNYYFFENFAFIFEKSNTNLQDLEIKVEFSINKSIENNKFFVLDDEFLRKNINQIDIYKNNIYNYAQLLKENENKELNFAYIFSENKQTTSKILINSFDRLENKSYLINKLKKEYQFSLINKKNEINGNDFLIIDDDIFLKKYNNLNNDGPNIAIKIENFENFSFQYTELKKTKNFNKWGIYLEKFGNLIYNYIAEINPSFLIISEELTKNLNSNTELIIFLETLNNICVENNIFIIFEIDFFKTLPSILKKIKCVYNYKK
ncbi:MHO_4530 family protein [[Mycoplasma] collis]|uniref:MHO_4530 family protein n=1 Tax=[Mycoplasma] collis TaxID=2127 RepID=UPI000B0E8F9D|nr:hypothetical protein [[Mycoplasma] collis]